MAFKDWNNQDQELLDFVSNQFETTIEVYRSDAIRVEEDLKKEIAIAEGGYGRKQVQELLQNAADALRKSNGRVEIVLTGDTLYVANQGHAFETAGVKGLLYTHLSNKTEDQIGRFGLGFKSISGISDRPQIFSQSVSFGFGREQTAEILSEELETHFDVGEVPGLRLAWPLDPLVEFEEDETLKSLAEWAVTIVKVPLIDSKAADDLSTELEAFDESFCLFAPQVNQLTFTNHHIGNYTTLETTKKGPIVSIRTDGNQDSEWLVLHRKHHPSEAALESAGNVARRESITVSWAVPMSGQPGVGQLTAYFPVMSQVTLSGRLNAPWKLSDDRMNIIKSEFNREILAEVVPSLVVEGRKHLVSTHPDGSENFGRYLDILPARGRESRSWADDQINEPIYSLLRTARSLPNANGEWRSPSQLLMIPEILVDLAKEWQSNAHRKDDWIHPDCISNTARRSKALRLQNKAKESDTPGLITKWLEDCIEGDDTNPSRSISAIKLIDEVTQILKANSDHVSEATKSRVVLLEDGTLVAPRPGNCFIRTNENQSGNAFILGEITADTEALKALEGLGITRYEDSGELYTFLRRLRKTIHIDWETGWGLMRGAPFDELKKAISEIVGPNYRRVFKVKNGLGEWVEPSGLFLPGAVFKPLKEDGKFLIDDSFHAADTSILNYLGIYDAPKFLYPVFDELWAKQYKAEMFQHLSTSLGIPEARRHRIEYRSDDMRLGPLEALPELSQTNKINLTKYVLGRAYPTSQVWYQDKDTKEKVISPEYWMLKNHGLLETSLGAFKIDECFFLSKDSEDVSRILPVVDDLDLGETAIEQLGCRTDIGQLTLDDFRLLPFVHQRRDDEAAVAESYAWWCLQFGDDAPSTMLVKLHDDWIERPPEQIAVTSEPQVEAEMESLGYPSLTVPHSIDAENLCAIWGLQAAHTIPKIVRFAVAAQPVALSFLFPALEYEEIHNFYELEVQQCESLAMESSMPGQPSVQKEVDYSRDGNILYTVAHTEYKILEHVLRLLELDTSKESIEAHLNSNEALKNNELRQTLKDLTTDEERLLSYAGEERLLSLIPQPAIEYIKLYTGKTPQGSHLAEICIQMFGSTTLEKACKVNHGNDLPISPPQKWSGSHAARKWVKDLGFDETWAGTKTIKKVTPTEYVNGPSQLEPFHDYQELVSSRLASMLSPQGKNRGIVNLPTGAGKTRVAVQTIVESIARGDLDYLSNSEFVGPILWLVDSQELCEQAVEAWSYLWRAKGRANTQLILSRHFDSHFAEEDNSGVQVVVATYQKTRGSVDDPNYDWLKETPLVIIDEAHGAISSSYTEILTWTGRTAYDRSKLLLGLSATPFRGSEDSAQTIRLHRRFDENFLADGVFGNADPLQWLQENRILSNVTMQVIQSQQPIIKLSKSETEEFKNKHWLPKKREQELGELADRTRQIIDSIKSLPDDWPILVFATSVDNAKTLATLLTMEGIPASAIDSLTPDAERSLALERFKSGEIRVITNYAVLSQGFDAPKTRAVYITRPVHSPVRYQQMIGRGLRGPKNGGTEDVLIVNLLDNIETFDNIESIDSSISYQDFEYLTGITDEEKQ